MVDDSIFPHPQGLPNLNDAASYTIQRNEEATRKALTRVVDLLPIP